MTTKTNTGLGTLFREKSRVARAFPWFGVLCSQGVHEDPDRGEGEGLYTHSPSLWS